MGREVESEAQIHLLRSVSIIRRLSLQQRSNVNNSFRKTNSSILVCAARTPTSQKAPQTAARSITAEHSLLYTHWTGPEFYWTTRSDLTIPSSPGCHNVASPDTRESHGNVPDRRAPLPSRWSVRGAAAHRERARTPVHTQRSAGPGQSW